MMFPASGRDDKEISERRYNQLNVFFIINNIVGAVFGLFYIYQLYFIFVSITKKPEPFPEAPPGRYAVLICACNESSVIGKLIDSIKEQDYPKELVDVYVIADNCTDDTADIARGKGAFVTERFDQERIGKGYALSCLFDTVSAGCTKWDYDGYFVFDADNILDGRFIKEMNKAVAAGNKIVTSYRNSKNYGDNWISSGYALWFLRETKYLNNSRQILGLSSQCSGTGFVIHRDILRKYGGWKYFTLTEDVEFTFAMVAQGEKIAFCQSAVLYDEQPVKFGVSWRQRTRWVKGYFQAYYRHGAAMVKGFFKRRDFSCYDMLVSTLAGALISLAVFVFYFIAIACYAVMGRPPVDILPWFVLYFGSCYMGLIVIGAITTKTEWDMIYCPPAKKLAYIITFPLFLFTLLPIALWAPFSKQHWSHIEHIRAFDLNEVRKGGG